jgi:hypothetical protein
VPNTPRLRALALFSRRPHQRVESLTLAGGRKPAQEQTLADATISRRRK